MPNLRCPECDGQDVEPYYFESGLWECHECNWQGYKTELKREE